MSRTPECDKMVAASDEGQTIGNFLEWAEENGYSLCRSTGNNYTPVRQSTEVILAEYFNIDLTLVEEERRALLERIRN